MVGLSWGGEMAERSVLCSPIPPQLHPVPPPCAHIQEAGELRLQQLFQLLLAQLVLVSLFAPVAIVVSPSMAISVSVRFASVMTLDAVFVTLSDV